MEGEFSLVEACMEDEDRGKCEVTITWPDLSFPPVNLWVVSPAWFFRADADERRAYYESLFNDR